MAKHKKGLSYEEKMIEALKKLPNPLEDKKHHLFIYLVNDRARSNQNRFEHIIDQRHGLCCADIERIRKHIKKAVLKKEHGRNDTYNIYLKRSNIGDEYIKICLKIDPAQPKIATIKTMFITTIKK